MFGLFKRRDSEEGQRGEPLPPRNEGLPDSDVKSGLCPRCQKQSSFEVLSTVPVTFEGGYAILPDGGREPVSSDQVSILLCRHCQQGVVVVEEQYFGEPEPGRGGRLILHRGIHWWPLPSASRSQDIPPKIAEVYSEAQRALAANCPRAAAVMSRRTLEAVTVELGEASGPLAQRLKTLEAAGKLHQSLADWATEVRLLGNAGAHFDPINSVSKEDAQALINFTRELLRYVFEYPAQVQRLRQERGAS